MSNPYGDPYQQPDQPGQQPYGQPQYGQPQYGQPPYGQPAYGGGYFPPPDHPNALLILLLGIVGLVFCQLAGPFAWMMGKKALDEIDRSGGTIGGRSQVLVGYITGIIATAILVLALLILVGVLVVILLAAAS